MSEQEGVELGKRDRTRKLVRRANRRARVAKGGGRGRHREGEGTRKHRGAKRVSAWACQGEKEA